MALMPPSISKLKIVLASSSKQRLDLLRQIGIEPIVKIPNADENLNKNLPPAKYVKELARKKAEAVLKQVREGDFDAIIACDTIIVYDGEIIGKPTTRNDAKEMLKKLSGKVHDVYTGVAIVDQKLKTDLFHERTAVKFCEIPDIVIDEYVASGESDNRAGSYGIQLKGAMFVEAIAGCYYNIVGLPINGVITRLWRIMKLC